MDYTTTVTCPSMSFPGVSFTVKRMSFAQRLGMLQRLRDLARRMTWEEAGKGPLDQTSAAITEGEMQRLYIEWGIVSISGLTLDGCTPQVSDLIERGPEELCLEMSAAVKRVCFLSANERKN